MDAMKTHRIIQVEMIYLRAPHTPHTGTAISSNVEGYRIDPDNGTIYPADDRTLLLKITCENGIVGWGETYGIVAAGAVRALVDDVVGPFLLGKDPLNVQCIWQSLYNLMRVRGYTGGFWLDALTASDIALWDLCGKITNLPIHQLLGGQYRSSIPAYITSIAGNDLAQRSASVAELYAQGFQSFKIHAASTFDYIELIRTLRERYADIELMLDLHWCHSASEASAIARQLEPYRIAFLEAPCHPEDVDGLARVADATSIPVAAGEEWRTVYEAHLRLKTGALGVIQPEMGRTGITQFLRICQLADIYHVRVAPHATIGWGVFMAASLHAASAVAQLSQHEYQNNFLQRHLHHFHTSMGCQAGKFTVPSGPGLGIHPKDSLWKYACS
jgi:D-galactarolactone cycloisomerase